MRKARVSFAAALLFCASAGAETINATSGPWAATLDGTWSWHAGDEMRWAAAAFDDSGWPILRVPGPVPPDRQYWLRLHVQTAKMADPALLLGPLAYAYAAYWDGRFLGQFGDVSGRKWLVPRWQVFRLAPDLAQPGTHVIAIRVRQIGTTFGTRTPGFEARDNQIGEFAAVQSVAAARLAADFDPRIFELVVVFAIFLAGCYFLLLPPSVSQGTSFRWLGVMLLARTLVVMGEFYANNGPITIPANVVISLVWGFGSLHFIAAIEFSYALFRRRVPVAIRGIQCFLALLAAPVPFPYSALFIRFNLFLVPTVIPIAVAVSEVRKRTVAAAMTLLVFVVWGMATLDNLLDVAYHLPVPTAIDISGFQLWTWDAALLLWVPAIAVQIHKMNQRSRDEQERLRGEMEAARQVQEVLVPSGLIKVPGFHIDMKYQPANEVGGDFFQLFPASQDSLLVVVGDVSGKGVRAALLVSVIVGALQNRKSNSPGALLRELNTVLLGRSEGGFTTCSCALFAGDGALTIASAGHLAPYCNGQEMAILPGLPLGIDGDASWAEMRVELAPGDRVVWVSDGIVEARNSKRDLLGFERAQELATRSASEIARAAQQFGQEDDITVVTIQRVPVPAYA
jgi:hypothetical protein